MNQSASTSPEWGTDTFFREATFEEVKRQLAAGADPNRRFADGKSAMHRAALTASDPAIISVLVEAGGDLHARDSHSQDTPLHDAASANANPEVIAAMVGAGAEIDAGNGLGRSPLLVAAEKSRHPAVVESLLNAGADLHARSPKSGMTALHFAALRKEVEFSSGRERRLAGDMIALLLARGADPNAEDRHGETPLHKAARTGGETGYIVKQLLDAGADPNLVCRTIDGRPPLHWAVEQFHGRPMAVLHLLEAGADPNGLDTRHGTSPLFWANTPECVEMLLKAGADPNLLSEGRRDTPLIRAIGMTRHADFDLRIAEMLLQAGADPDTREGGWRRTALHYAAADGSFASVRLLLDAGADATAEDDHGDTPLRLAEKQWSPEGADKCVAIAEALRRTFGQAPPSTAEP